MKVLITGGGTGGHVNPALAVADKIKEYCPEAEIAFVGTPDGIENELVPAAGYPVYHVNVIGFRRKLSLRNVRAAWLALVSPLRAARIIRKFRPDIVFGTGGYTSWPILVAASRKKIVTGVHEANAVPGLAVRKLVPYVDRVFVNFKVSMQQLPAAGEKAMHVGCPLRSGIGNIGKAEARRRLGIPQDSFSVVSFGGSLGAERMNSAAFDYMVNYVTRRPEINYLHAAGGRYFDGEVEKFLAAGLDNYPNIRLVKYITDMPLRLAAADLVICRSGAITVSELSRAGKASILIPSPNVTDNQQYKNARVLSDCGGAVLIEEKDLADGRLAEETERLKNDPEKLRAMGDSIRAVSPPDAEGVIAKELFRLLAGKIAKE